MQKRKSAWFVSYLCIAAVAVFLVYNVYNNNKDKSHINNVKANIKENQEKTKSEEVIAIDVARITASTKLIYEYYYTDDGQIKREEEIPSYFLMDMSREELKERFPDWELQSFSEKEVVMRKNIEGKSQERYIIGIHEGYVAVFFEDPIDGEKLRDLTNTPIESLNPDDRAKLESGISIIGAEALISALEDYES